MAQGRDLREVPELPKEVTDAALKGELVLFIGAGVSKLLGLPSWMELAQAVLGDLRDEGLLNYSEIEQLKHQDPKKLLSIATIIAEEHEYALDIAKHLNEKPEDNGVYSSINAIGCSCVTTNYDELLAPHYVRKTDGSKTQAETKRVSEPEKFLAKLLDEPGTVVHLHGCVSKPKTMVVTTRQYLEHYDHKNVQSFLGALFARKTVVFLGYGLEEAEILEHILRRGRVEQTKDRRRFLLQGFFGSQAPLYQNLRTYYEKSFGVHLVGFLRDFDNYQGLEKILRTWVDDIDVHEPPLASDVEFMEEVLGDE